MLFSPGVEKDTLLSESLIFFRLNARSMQSRRRSDFRDIREVLATAEKFVSPLLPCCRDYLREEITMAILGECDAIRKRRARAITTVESFPDRFSMRARAFNARKKVDARPVSGAIIQRTGETRFPRHSDPVNFRAGDSRRPRKDSSLFLRQRRFTGVIKH